MEPHNPQPENEYKPEPVQNSPEPQPVPAPAQLEPQAYQHPVAPAVAPAQPAVEPATPHAQNTPGVIILQWLTYAFWGWTVLAFGVLIATVLSYVIADADVGGSIPYELAAIIVLLPISLIIDHFYSRSEPTKKTGVATLVMVIHAVIFALFGIGAVIFAVFALVKMFVSASDSNDSMVMLASSAIIAVVYGAVLLRTINPSKIPWIQKGFSLFMILLLVITAIAAIAGPVVSERTRRNDKLIEENLSTVTRAINNYANENDSLPSSLDALDLSEDTQRLIDSNLLKYTPNTKPAATAIDVDMYQPETKTFYYTICAHFDKSREDKYGYRDYASDKKNDGYDSDVNAYEHASGEVCYKVATDYFSY